MKRTGRGLFVPFDNAMWNWNESQFRPSKACKKEASNANAGPDEQSKQLVEEKRNEGRNEGQ